MGSMTISRQKFDVAYNKWFKVVGSNTNYPKSFWEFLGRDQIVSYSQDGVILSPSQLARLDLITGPNGYTIIKAYVAQHEK